MIIFKQIVGVILNKLDSILNKITNLSRKRILLFVYVTSLIVQTISINLFLAYSPVKLNDDLWYKATGKNIINKHAAVVNWGDKKESDLYTNFNLQKGTYYDWRPIGYSLILTIPAFFGKNFELAKVILQLIIYSLIPVFIFLLFNILFLNYANVKKISLIAALLYLIYPNFIVSSLQTIDTWITTLLILIILYFYFKSNFSYKFKYMILIGLSLSFLYLVRPAGAATALIFIFISYFASSVKKYSIGFLFIPLLFLILTITLWSIRNHSIFDKWYPSFTNIGYNLWLGNNDFTSRFLKSHLGDGTSIEAEIIPNYDVKWSELSVYNELQKNSFLFGKAVEFITNNPLKFINNTAWKIIGYWSPLRVRTVAQQNSLFKTIIVFIFSFPIIILSLISIALFLLKREFRFNEIKTYVLIFILLWMIPYIFFFATARFREPTNFCLLYLCFDLIMSQYKKKQILYLNNKYTN